MYLLNYLDIFLQQKFVGLINNNNNYKLKIKRYIKIIVEILERK